MNLPLMCAFMGGGILLPFIDYCHLIVILSRFLTSVQGCRLAPAAGKIVRLRKRQSSVGFWGAITW